MAGNGIIKTVNQVYNLVEHRVDGKWRPEDMGASTFLMWDDYYYIPTAGEARNMVLDACKNLPSYSSYDFDCDDFAFYARGRAGAYAARQEWSNAGICVGLFDAECYWVDWTRHMACWALVQVEEGDYAFLLIDPGEFAEIPAGAKGDAAYPTHPVEEIQNLATLLI